jgi:ABC-2 type transport system ATP-binding protein
VRPGGESYRRRSESRRDNLGVRFKMSAVIETHELSKTYGKFGALDRLSLSVPEGCIFALMGASGAGKTTAIKILLNMISPSHGSAKVLGVDSRRIDWRVLQEVGYVSESQILPGRLRVDEFFNYLRRCYPRWDRHLESELRSQLGLPPDRRIRDLSHGMRLKMALACALPFRPRLLILDEPFTGLDALTRDEVVAGFLRQAREMSILISSHELDEIERLATHAAVMHEGRLLFQGPIAQLREHARPALIGESAGSDPVSLRKIFVALVRAASKNET